jgi:hypothetical protein
LVQPTKCLESSDDGHPDDSRQSPTTVAQGASGCAQKLPAVAEAAEKHFARAKDATKLYEAVEAKLTEQRKFVLWWDGQEKRRATPGNLGPSQTNDAPAAQDFGLDRDTIHRWRSQLVGLKDLRAATPATSAAHLARPPLEPHRRSEGGSRKRGEANQKTRSISRPRLGNRFSGATEPPGEHTTRGQWTRVAAPLPK